VPVEINHEPYLTLGVHIGARTTSIAATDLFGRTLDVVETPTPQTGHAVALDALAGSARRYLSRWHRRRPLWVGVAMGGVVDPATGTVDHARLGWTRAPVGSVFAETMGLPVSVAVHVDAMAGAELLLGMTRLAPASGSALPSALRASGSSLTSLYVYARETVGYALVIGGRVHSPATGPGTIAVAITIGAERPLTGVGLLAFFLGASVAAVVNAAIIWIAYRFADRLTELMGATARAVIVRLTAFLLMCIGVQILVTAIGDLIAHWRAV